MYMCVMNYLLLNVKFEVIVKLAIRRILITRLFGAWVTISFYFKFLIENKLFVKYSSNYFMNLMNGLFL